MSKKIAIMREGRASAFEGESYEVDLARPFGGHEAGDLICSACPFAHVLPLELEIAIRADGSLVFRSWSFVREANIYLHTSEKPAADCESSVIIPFIPTQAQIDTVGGLFSGRIKFEGLKLEVGATVQKICPIDVAKEESLIGKKIYLA